MTTTSNCRICGKGAYQPHTAETREAHREHLTRHGFSGMCPTIFPHVQLNVVLLYCKACGNPSYQPCTALQNEATSRKNHA